MLRFQQPPTFAPLLEVVGFEAPRLRLLLLEVVGWELHHHRGPVPEVLTVTFRLTNMCQMDLCVWTEVYCQVVQGVLLLGRQ